MSVRSLGGLEYPILLSDDGYDGLGEALASALGPVARAVLVTDTEVGPRWAAAVRDGCPGIDLQEISLPVGEQHKTIATWAGLMDDLLGAGMRRGMPVLALGGGVVGDIAGFAAATVLRGVPVVQLPTSLLAMVDSSIGGKTGVNHPRGKNLVGAFHQPVLVWAALPTLGTLPGPERVAGYGEVLKTALVGDASLFERLERGPVPIEEVVARCVEVKARVVARDVHESGLRMILNAGHTVGHAIETALGHGRIAHGGAVAVGLVLEASYAVRAGICEDAGLPDRIGAVARRVGLPTTLPEVDPARLLQAVTVDKKGSTDRLAVPLPVRAGVYKRVSLSWTEAANLLDHPR